MFDTETIQRALAQRQGGGGFELPDFLQELLQGVQEPQESQFQPQQQPIDIQQLLMMLQQQGM